MKPITKIEWNIYNKSIDVSIGQPFICLLTYNGWGIIIQLKNQISIWNN